MFVCRLAIEIGFDFSIFEFCYLIFTSTLSSCHVLANHFFACIFSNFNFRSR